MKALPGTRGFKTAISITAVTIFATGCSCFKGREARYQTAPAPIVSSESQPPPPQPMGGTGIETQTSAGAGGTSSETVIPLHEEKLVAGTQQTTEGAVRIRKEVKTETVNQPVQVRRETVTVERVPAGQANAQAGAQPEGGQGDLNTPFKSGEMTINLHEEKPFAQTETVPAGSIVVRKKVTTEPITIQRQVRREVATAVPLGNSKDVTISGNLNGSQAQPEAMANPNEANEASGAGPSNSGQSGGAGGSSAGITQWSQLTSTPNPTTLAGQQVNLSGVKVQQLMGDHLLAVGPDKNQPIYVQSDKPLTGIAPGDTVNLRGTVRPMPSDPSALGLDQQSASALQGQSIIIAVPEVNSQNQ